MDFNNSMTIWGDILRNFFHSKYLFSFLHSGEIGQICNYISWMIWSILYVVVNFLICVPNGLTNSVGILIGMEVICAQWHGRPLTKVTLVTVTALGPICKQHRSSFSTTWHHSLWWSAFNLVRVWLYSTASGWKDVLFLLKQILLLEVNIPFLYAILLEKMPPMDSNNVVSTIKKFYTVLSQTLRNTFDAQRSGVMGVTLMEFIVLTMFLVIQKKLH